ncbi:hypothetical protein [Natrinema salaciae]|uniref:hypothetical protein n=1 Tax=Natrinema salaciae TaxID=1186196 RepID=UPI001587BC2F|nr:hypothetical protein [Natrinema salaciae]
MLLVEAKKSVVDVVRPSLTKRLSSTERRVVVNRLVDDELRSLCDEGLLVLLGIGRPSDVVGHVRLPFPVAVPWDRDGDEPTSRICCLNDTKNLIRDLLGFLHVFSKCPIAPRRQGGEDDPRPAFDRQRRIGSNPITVIAAEIAEHLSTNDLLRFLTVSAKRRLRRYFERNRLA